MTDQQRTAEDDLEAGFREASGDEPVETREVEPQQEQMTDPANEEAGQGHGQEEGPEGEPSDPKPPEEPVLPGLGMTASQVREQLGMVERMRGDFDQSLRRAYGKIGELNSTVQQLQQARGPGKVNEQALQRLKDEYGDELAEIIPSLFLPSQDPAGSQEPSGFNPDTLRQEFNERLQQSIASTTDEVTVALVSALHPDWKQQKASPEFEEWRSTQPSDVQHTLQTSRDPAFVVQQLTAFKDWKKSKASAAGSRNRRLENAIAPDGVETAGSREPSPDDAFLAGFREEAGR